MRRGSDGGERTGRSLGYVRISHGDPEADSLDAQEEAIAALCAARGRDAPEVRLEVESAGEEKIERRTELARLIADARPGDLIVVAALDRWSRDMVFGVQSVRQLVRAGIGWYAIREGIDASTPEGDSNLGIRMWLAEEERKRIRARTIGARDRLRSKGLWAAGTVPYGYQRGARERREHLLLSVHPERAPRVLELHHRAARSESLRDLAAWIGQYDGAPRHPTGLHRLLRGRTYLGEMLVDGAWIRGQHPPLITLDLWEQVQAGLVGRRNYGRLAFGAKTEDCLLRNFVRCALCGRRCGVAVGKLDHRYYVCGARRHSNPTTDVLCAGPYYRTDAADAAATVDVLARIGELREELEEDVGRLGVATRDTSAARARIDARLARAVGLAVEGTITSAELADVRARLEAERAALARREAEAGRAERARVPAVRRDVAAALRHLARTWGALTNEERREAVRLLAAGVEITEGKGLRWAWRTIEDLAADRG